MVKKAVDEILKKNAFTISKATIGSVIQWGGGLIVSIATIAFTMGKLKTEHLDKLNIIEEQGRKNQQEIIQFRDETILMFQQYQDYNNKQLTLVIDYGSTNKQMLKDMLAFRQLELTNILNPNKISSEKVDNVSVEKVDEVKQVEDVQSKQINKSNIVVTKVGSNDSTYIKRGVDETSISEIKKKYKIKEIVVNNSDDKLFDIKYSNR